MGRTPGRSPNRHQGSDKGGWSAIPDDRVERLRQRFMRFRRTHKPRTRFPQSLRMAVLAALHSGVAEPELRCACGLSTAQLAAWRRGAEAEAQQRSLDRTAARVFPVVDEFQPDVSDGCTIHPAGQPMELRIGGWSVSIRQLEE